MSKLLVFTENYSRGGGNRYMIDLVNSVADHYTGIYIATNKGGLFHEDFARLNRVVFFHYLFFITRSRIRNAISFLPRVVRGIFLLPFTILEPCFLLLNICFFICKLKQIEPSTIISCNGGYPASKASLAMVIAAGILQIPVALSIVSMPTHRKVYTKLYEKMIDKLIWSIVRVVIVNAKIIAKALHSSRGMPYEIAKIVYNGLEDRPYNYKAKNKEGIFIIGCIARMDASKGVFYLLDAFSQLAKNRPQLRLVLAGEGDASEQLLRKVDELGLQNQVQLLGHYKDNVCDLLEMFDVYVFPSLWEGFPYSIIEAMRSACVIVATKIGGIPEAISDGHEGILIQHASADAIVDAVKRLIDDPERCQILAHNARLKYESEFSLQRMLYCTREALNPLLFLLSVEKII